MLVFIFLFLRDKKTNQEYENYTTKMQSFDTDVGVMKYLDIGEGTPILLLHGVPTSSWMYRKLSLDLSKNGYRVIAIDMIGFGASDKPKGYDIYNFDKQADRIFALMEHLNIESWDQIIHDMGGIVTWEMIKKDSDKISHLYILNTLLYKTDFHPPLDFSYKNPIHVAFLKLHKNKFIGKVIVNNMLKTGTNKYKLDYEEKRGYWLPLQGGADALVHFFTNTKWIKQNLSEYRNIFKDFDGRISIIWGENDPFLGVEQVSKFQNDFDIPDENILILENKKHLILEEASDEIIEFMLKNQD